jgi:hypothetical protein
MWICLISEALVVAKHLPFWRSVDKTKDDVGIPRTSPAEVLSDYVIFIYSKCTNIHDLCLLNIDTAKS